MNPSEPPSRLSTALWLLGLSAIAVWLPGRVLPAVVLAVLAGLFVRSLRRAGALLPERVASHFNLFLRPDGWMGRRAYLIVMAVIAVAFGGLVPGSMLVVGIQGGQVAFQRLALWIACMTLSLLLGVHELIVDANARDPVELPRSFWVLMATFTAAIVSWSVAMG
jgi:hypothetical protein